VKVREAAAEKSRGREGFYGAIGEKNTVLGKGPQTKFGLLCLLGKGETERSHKKTDKVILIEAQIGFSGLSC